MNLEQNNQFEEQTSEHEPLEKSLQEPGNQNEAKEEVSPDTAQPDTEAEERNAAAEEEPAVNIKEDETAADAGDATQEESDEKPVDAGQFYGEIVKKAAEVVSQNDWSFATNELANMRLQIEEGPEPDTDESKNLIKEFGRIRDDFEARKREYYEELNKKRQENLARKKELLKEFAEIINNEQWSATKEVNKIQSEWEQIKSLPQGEADAINERFAALLSDFEDHKVDRLVKKLQKEEENLTLKLVLQDKMDIILANSNKEESNFEALSKELNNLISQWRKVGHVPVDKNDSIWERFNQTVDQFSELRYKYDETYRKAIDKATEQKKKLVADAELLIDEDDIANAARKVNALHKAWKKVKTLPQKDENELWEQFKTATDAFNEKKTENIDVLRDLEQKNMELKLGIIEKAESIQHTEDYEAGHKVMQLLMEEWKKIGPVPRKKSAKIWSSFKSAMDFFYEERREHFKDIRKDQKDNLDDKKTIIDKLIALGEHEDPAAAVEEAKILQEQFKNIGHVPLKSKNKIWKQYREACDLIYDRFRAMGNDLNMERKLATQGVEPKDRKLVIKLEKELNHVRKDISKLEAEILQFEEAQTYFKPTKKGNKLLDDLNDKIEKANKQLGEKRDRLEEIASEINELTR